jgi:hypothetical protein
MKRTISTLSFSLILSALGIHQLVYLYDVLRMFMVLCCTLALLHFRGQDCSESQSHT